MTLSLDQSLSNCAWTLWNENSELKSFGIWSPTKELDDYGKIDYILNGVYDFIVKEGVKQLIVESLPYGSNSISTRALAGLFYSLGVLAYQEGIEFSPMVITSVKKCATGKGNCLKTEMYQQLPKELQDKFLSYQLSELSEKKKANLMERYDNMTEYENYFKSSTFLLDLSDSYWIYKMFKGECK